jgi:hypothetical protein
MGRRAKNKQAAPIPFSEPRENDSHPSPKKLGKRKAEAEDVETRPVKKVKETQSKGTGKFKTKITGEVKGKSSKTQEKVKVSKKEVGGSDEAWEDVDDEIDLKAQVK